MANYAIRTPQGNIVHQTANSGAEALDRFAVQQGRESASSLMQWERETYGHTSELIGESVTQASNLASLAEEPAPKTLPSNPPVDTLDQADLESVGRILDIDVCDKEAASIVGEWSYEAVEYAYLSVATAREAAAAEWERKTGREAVTAEETVVFESNFMQALSNPYMWRAVQQESQKRRAARSEP